MITLTLRTDKPEAEIGLYDGLERIAYETWHAHRELAETIYQHIQSLLEAQRKNWQDIDAIIVYKGPGSFTGLRIGISLVNALSYGLGVPIRGATGDDWVRVGLKDLSNNKPSRQVTPAYGSPVHITLPKK